MSGDLAAATEPSVALLRRIAAALGLPGDLQRADKYRMQSDPALLRDVAAAMAALLPSDTEILVGLPLSGWVGTLGGFPSKGIAYRAGF